MSTTQRPVVWVGEPDGFCEKAKHILESNAQVIFQKIANDQLAEVFNSCDAFFFRLGIRINATDINRNQRCKIIATPVTGLDHIDIKACHENNIQLISLKGETDFLQEVRATAEHTIGLLLAVIRNLVPAVQHVSQKKFERDLFRGHELYHKTIGIIGFGRLGKIVANYAKAFGMQVLIYEKNRENAFGDPEFVFLALDDLIKQSDYISLHVDANEDNFQMVNGKFLSLMKRDSYLINTSRGSLIDETALVNALETGLIAGAALDVVKGEPTIDFESKLFQYQRMHSNLLITPHIGGGTTESFEKTECFIANKIIEQLLHA